MGVRARGFFCAVPPIPLQALSSTEKVSSHSGPESGVVSPSLLMSKLVIEYKGFILNTEFQTSRVVHHGCAHELIVYCASLQSSKQDILGMWATGIYQAIDSEENCENFQNQPIEDNDENHPTTTDRC